MKHYTSTTGFNCGIDLHGRQMYACVMDRLGNKLVHRNIKGNDFAYFLKLIAPYRHNLTVVSECTFNWHWLADACFEEGIEFVLAHALYLKLIHGGKNKNDRIDSEKLASLMQQAVPEDRLDQLPPEHPSGTKAKAIKKRGEEDSRQALWRFSGVDLTRIDAISTGTATTVLTEVGFGLGDFPTEKRFVSWLRLAPNRQISGGKVLNKKSAMLLEPHALPTRCACAPVPYSVRRPPSGLSSVVSPGAKAIRLLSSEWLASSPSSSTACCATERTTWIKVRRPTKSATSNSASTTL